MTGLPSAGGARLEPLTLELDGSTPEEPEGFPPLQMWVYLAAQPSPATR